MPCSIAPPATTIAIPAAAASASVAPGTQASITAVTASDPIALAARSSARSAGLFTSRSRQPRSSWRSSRPVPTAPSIAWYQG